MPSSGDTPACASCRPHADRHRAILHVDMDAFFASVEVADNPELRGKPLVVGAPPESHGVVAAASYEARRFGVRSAMPMARALALCPHCVRVPARHGRYVDVSKRVLGILRRFTPAVEQVSIDEAYLDVTGSARLFGDAEGIARRIKRAVRPELGLTASVGVATNRLVAKVASDLEKPDGLVTVAPGTEAGFLAPMRIEKLPGIGPSTAKALHELGVATLGELATYPAAALEERFGVTGAHFVARARGEDETPIGGGPEGKAPARKSISAETTFAEFTADKDEIERELLSLSERVAGRARSAQVEGRTVTLKLRDDLFATRTRAETLPRATNLGREVFEAARALYAARPVGAGRKVRLLGVALSKLEEPGGGQLDLLVDESREREKRLESVVDEIRDKLGDDAVVRGRLVKRPEGDERSENGEGA